MKANYNTVFKEIIQVVANGNTALKVMEVLEKQGLVTGKLTEPIQWIFNFQGGGWNTVMAISLQEAQKKVKEEYGTLTPLLHTVRPCAEEDYNGHMRNFD
jgi:hypothetical protein